MCFNGSSMCGRSPRWAGRTPLPDPVSGVPAYLYVTRPRRVAGQPGCMSDNVGPASEGPGVVRHGFVRAAGAGDGSEFPWVVRVDSGTARPSGRGSVRGKKEVPANCWGMATDSWQPPVTDADRTPRRQILGGDSLGWAEPKPFTTEIRGHSGPESVRPRHRSPGRRSHTAVVSMPIRPSPRHGGHT